MRGCFSLLAVASVGLDVYIVQDSTHSFADKLGGIADGASVIPSDARVGLAEFKDKPYNYLGSPQDYCVKILSEGGNASSVGNSIRNISAVGGGDEADAQLQALAEVAINAKWTAPMGERLIILNTDSRPHNPNEYHKYANNPTVPAPRPPVVLPLFPDPAVVSGTTESRCSNNDYPTQFQVSQYLKLNGVNVLFIIPETANNAQGVWRNFNSNLLNQPNGFVASVNDNYSNYGTALQSALSSYNELHGQTTAAPTVAPTTTLAPSTTTTTAPTTETTTTTAPTTETTTTTSPTTATSTSTTAPASTTTATAPAPTTTTTAPTTSITSVASTSASSESTTVPSETTTVASSTTVPSTAASSTTASNSGTTTATIAPTTLTGESTTSVTAATTTETPLTAPTSSGTAPATTETTTATTTNSTLRPTSTSTPTATSTRTATTVPLTTSSSSEKNHRPALVLRVNNNPAKLIVDYEA